MVARKWNPEHLNSWPYPFGRRGGRDEWQWCRRQDLAGCQPMGGGQRLYHREAGRLAGCRPVFFFDVAAFDESVVTSGSRTDEQWRVATPKQFPTYAQWQCEVAAVTRLSNPDDTAQHLLDSIRGVSEAEWTRLLSGFSDLMAFSLWMELVLDIEGPTSGLASKELAREVRWLQSRGRGNRIQGSCSRHSTIGRSSMHSVLPARNSLLAALSFHVSHHPRILRNSELCVALSRCLAGRMPDHPPSFEEWREAADAYFEDVGNQTVDVGCARPSIESAALNLSQAEAPR